MPSTCQSCLVFNVFLQRTCFSSVYQGRNLENGFSPPPARETFPRGSAQGSGASRYLPLGATSHSSASVHQPVTEVSSLMTSASYRLAFKSLTAPCKMSSSGASPLETGGSLLKLHGCALCRMERWIGGGRSTSACRRKCVLISSLFSYKGAQSSKRNNWSPSLLHFTFHTRQRAQPPPASERQREELAGQLLGVRGHQVLRPSPRREGGWREDMPNTLGCKCLPCLQPVISSPPDVSSSILERKEPSVLFTFLREVPQMVKELMFISVLLPRGRQWIKHKVWLWLIQDLISRVVSNSFHYRCLLLSTWNSKYTQAMPFLYLKSFFGLTLKTNSKNNKETRDYYALLMHIQEPF